MLLGQHRRRHKNRNLLAEFHGFEGSAHGQLGFAVADVAAEQAIHGAGFLHVLLDVVGAGDLICGRFIRKFGLEFLLPFGVGGIGEAGFGSAGGLDFKQFRGHVHDGFGDFGFFFLP